MDLSRELLAAHDGEIRSLHRERALLLIKLFEVNRDLETVRETILKPGGVIGHELDGWSAKLFSTSSCPFERSLRRALKGLLHDQMLIAVGDGGPGDPFRYFLDPVLIGMGFGGPEAAGALMEALEAAVARA